MLVGGGGADRFVYSDTDDSTPNGADRILDFSRAQGDRIDLRDIDANEQRPATRRSSSSARASSRPPGQLQFYQADGQTFIEANTTDATPAPS